MRTAGRDGDGMQWMQYVRLGGAVLSLSAAGADMPAQVAREAWERPGATRPAAAPPAGETVKLDPLKVQATHTDPGYDATGMGSYENQFRDPPFSNDLISAEEAEDDALAVELKTELQQIANPSPVDLATGDARLGLRGFATPLMRNGFVTMGASDMLNTSRTITIQGALVPVLGRAAPGGIQDFITWRPRATAGKRLDYTLSSLRRQAGSFEWTGPAVPKRAWQRLAGEWSRKRGPEEFAASDTRALSGALTWRHSAAASTLFALDFHQVHATAAPGIPEYRPATGQKIIGPYLPLAGFNALGPEAGVRRRTTAATLLFDGQPHKKLALRAGLEAWWREVEQDRFTTSLYNVALGRFEGTREPRHLVQPQAVQLAHVEATLRLSGWGAEHKVLAALNQTWGNYEREELALSVAARNALPASVRLFDPDAPDYSRPAFSRAVYDRVLTDREERARYTAAELSHRAALRQGRLVFTSGLRHDFVVMSITDRRVGVGAPRVRDSVDHLTYHTGVNYQAVPSRLLMFATMATAFEPSSRVDARTGELQPNATTRGYEAGFKWRVPKREAELSVVAFSLFNEDIVRRNPLYDDPIQDANHTQPQLVRSGGETFRGARIEGRWKAAPTLSLLARAAYARALTTASPDLPQEVGRALTRLPPLTASASASYGFRRPALKGLSTSMSWTYVSGFVAQYEDTQRQRLEFPSYGQFTVGASYARKVGKLTHSVGGSWRNVLDYAFREKQARLGSEPEVTVTYRVAF